MSRLAWPTAALLFLTLTFVYATLVWTSEGVSLTASKRQRMQLAGAIEQQLGDVRDRLVEVVRTPALFRAARGEFGGRVALAVRNPQPSSDLDDVSSFLAASASPLRRGKAHPTPRSGASSEICWAAFSQPSGLRIFAPCASLSFKG